MQEVVSHRGIGLSLPFCHVIVHGAGLVFPVLEAGATAVQALRAGRLLQAGAYMLLGATLAALGSMFLELPLGSVFASIYDLLRGPPCLLCTKLLCGVQSALYLALLCAGGIQFQLAYLALQILLQVLWAVSARQRGEVWGAWFHLTAAVLGGVLLLRGSLLSISRRLAPPAPPPPEFSTLDPIRWVDLRVAQGCHT